MWMNIGGADGRCYLSNCDNIFDVHNVFSRFAAFPRLVYKIPKSSRSNVDAGSRNTDTCLFIPEHVPKYVESLICDESIEGTR